MRDRENEAKEREAGSERKVGGREKKKTRGIINKKEI